MKKNASKNIIMKSDGEEVEYTRSDCVESTINFDATSTLAGCMVGKKVLVRSRNEGINCGIVEAADDTGVLLKNVRRLWYHKPADSDCSWYEGVAMHGLHSSSKVSCTVNRKVIVEQYSLTECEETAYKTIMDKVPHAQS